MIKPPETEMHLARAQEASKIKLLPSLRRKAPPAYLLLHWGLWVCNTDYPPFLLV